MEFNPKLGLAGTTETIQVVSETPAINVLNAEQATTVTESQIRELPTITRNPYDLVAACGQASPRRSGDRRPRHRLRDQRSALVEHQHPARRLGEQRRVHGDGRPGRAARLRAGVLGHHLELLGPVRPRHRRRRERGHQVGHEPVPRHGLRVLPQRRPRRRTPSTTRRTGSSKGKFDRHQTGFSLGGPVVKDKVHFFASGEYIRVRSTDTEISWVPTPEFIAASSPATQAFFNAYGGGATINGPILTRGDVSAIVGTAAGAFNSLPAGLPVFGRVEKSAADRRRRRRPAGPVPVRRPPRLQPERDHPGLRPLRLPEPGDGAGHERLEPLRRVRHGLSDAEEPQRPRLADPRLLADASPARRRSCGTSIFGDQPLNGDPQPDALHEPDDAPCASRATASRSPATCRGTRAARSRSAARRSCSQFYQDFNWVKGRHDLRFGGYYMHINDDRTFGAYANSVEALNTTSAALPSLDNFVAGQTPPVSDGAINPNGFPGGTYTTPVGFPSFSSNNTLRRVRALRERHVERQRPAEAEPRPALRVLRAAEEERAQVRLQLLLQRRRAAR